MLCKAYCNEHGPELMGKTREEVKAVLKNERAKVGSMQRSSVAVACVADCNVIALRKIVKLRTCER